MFKTTLKIAAALSVLAISSTSAYAGEEAAVSPTATASASEVLFSSAASVETSQNCSTQLSGEAFDIYATVSPEVVGDSNLHKLVKKVVRPKVFKGQLSIKDAKTNARAAAECLSLLKVEKARLS